MGAIIRIIVSEQLGSEISNVVAMNLYDHGDLENVRVQAFSCEGLGNYLEELSRYLLETEKSSDFLVTVCVHGNQFIVFVSWMMDAVLLKKQSGILSFNQKDENEITARDLISKLDDCLSCNKRPASCLQCSIKKGCINPDLELIFPSSDWPDDLRIVQVLLD